MVCPASVRKTVVYGEARGEGVYIKCTFRSTKKDRCGWFSWCDELVGGVEAMADYVAIRMTVAQANAVTEAAQAELFAADENGSITKAELRLAEAGIDAIDKAVRRHNSSVLSSGGV